MTTETNAPTSSPPGGVGDSLLGKEIDGCTIVRKIGQGGMGIVYLAEHTKLKQQYVVKILNPALTAAEDTVQRFFREAQSVARLNHPSIVGIQNVGQEGDYYYIRMEYVDGDTVENVVKEQKKLDWKLATKVVLDTAEALSHAHKKGIVHRDIKPENIMLTKTGEVKVMDFGLAKQVSAATKVSVTGQIVGTPFFMSPEQAGGKTTDARSDIYSLGVTYYYLLTGVKPFNGKNLQEIFLKHFFYTPESPKIYTPDLPEQVCEVIRRCLKKKKKERYQSAAQLSQDLRVALGLDQGELSNAPEAGALGESDETGPPNAGATAVAAGRVATSSSDPAIDLGATNRVFERPAPGGDLQSDLAAAQQELGGDGEPGTIVARSNRDGDPNGSTETSEEAAPIQRRGNRVSLEQMAGASVVFTSPPPMFPPAEAEQDVAGEEEGAPDPSSIPAAILERAFNPDETMRTPGTRGERTATLERPDQKETPTTPKAPPKGVVALVLIALALVLAIGTYQFMGASQFGVLEKRYEELKANPPPSTDAKPWQDRAEQFTQIASDADAFLQSPFRFCTKSSAAATLVDLARMESLYASNEALKIIRSSGGTDVPNELREREQQFEKDLGLYKNLVASKRYEEAGKFGAQLHERAKELGEKFLAQVLVPIDVVSDPPGAKVYEEGSQAVLGVTPGPGGSPCIVEVRPFRPLTLEVRLPKFQTKSIREVITGFRRIDVGTLERDVVRRYTVGKTREMPWGRDARRTFDVAVDVPSVIDPTGKNQAATLNVIGRDGTLRALDLKSGQTVAGWDLHGQKIGEFGDPSPGPDVLPGKAIVTAGADGVVRVHRVETGHAMWTKSVGAPVGAAPRFSADEKLVAVGTLYGDVAVFDAVSGSLKWKVTFEGPIATSPVFQGERLYVGSVDDKLRALELATGKVVAVYDAKEAISAGPVIFGDLVYVGTREGRVHAVNATTLQPAFTTAPAGAPIRQLVALSELVYFSTDAEFRAVSPAAKGNLVGEPYRGIAAPATIAGFVPMNGDRVALVSSSGTVISLEVKTGNVLWFYEIKPRDPKLGEVSVAVPPLFHNDELLVTTRAGDIVVLMGD